MPYSKLSEANIQHVDGVPLTLAQANDIAKMADAIGGDNAWAIAVSQFKKGHTAKKGAWVKAEKELDGLYIQKEDDGRYKIVAISTAALPDRENETFTTKAMDYEIAASKQTGDYPEFRVFHRKELAIGRVTKMDRVGIFAVDEGYSYPDAFSKEFCEKVLTQNNGDWRISRGFYVMEASGGCPNCNQGLLVQTKHMLAGFSCPVCKSVHLSYKGALKNLRFLKTRTFDITVTDIPCQPFTGVSAFSLKEFNNMKKEQLKEKLLEAGIAEDLIDARLKDLSDAQLKELDGIPEATLLKEFSADDAEPEAKEAPMQEVAVDDALVNAFAQVVAKQVQEALTGLEIELEQPEMKEGSEIMAKLEALEGQMAELKEMVDAMAAGTVKQAKEMVKDMPRATKTGLRIFRYKATPEEGAAAEEEDEEEAEMPMKGKGKAGKVCKEQEDGSKIVDSDGEQYASMTDFISAH